MEGNDIGLTVHRHVACMFEGLLMSKLDISPATKRGFMGRFKKDEAPTETEFIQAETRLWRPNDLPLKSVIHMTKKLGISVEVYTYMDLLFVDAIEEWLRRKGADVQVWCYHDLDDLRNDFKYNRDVHTFFTTSEEDAAVLGPRATCVNPDGSFGF